MRQVGGATAAGEQEAAAFGAAVAILTSAREQLAAIRPELCFEEVPAPRTLAPFATALGASVRVSGTEVASGRFVLLYDPAGQRGWGGPLRVIVYIRAEVEQEIAEDPMVGQVAWSWLTEALDARTAGYSEPSGTVTRVITEGFGVKGGEPPSLGFELRASWSPASGLASLGEAASGLAPPGEAASGLGPSGGAAGTTAPADPAGDLAGHLAAWCGVLCAASGLPPVAPGVTALRPAGRRRGR
jgi:hypothetical protein